LIVISLPGNLPISSLIMDGPELCGIRKVNKFFLDFWQGHLVSIRTDCRRSRRYFSSQGNNCLHLKGISAFRQCKSRL
jgi:hypothetical protein